MRTACIIGSDLEKGVVHTKDPCYVIIGKKKLTG